MAAVDRAGNEQLLSLLSTGQLAALHRYIPGYSASCKADMGLKALAFVEGTGLWREGHPALVKAYGGIYGTGAAVVEFSSST